MLELSTYPLLEPPEKELIAKELIIHIDGVARGNPGEGGIGVIIETPDGETVEEIGRYIGVTTNNYAEYEALLTALKTAVKYNPSKVTVFSDSQLLVRQMNGIYQIKSKHLIPLYKQSRSLIDKIGNVIIIHVPREKNKEADKLANRAVNLKLS